MKGLAAFCRLRTPVLQLLLLLFFISSAFVSAQAECVTGRISTLIDRDWRFTRGNVAGAEAPSFDAGTWERVNLPHSFSMPYFLGPDFYSGYGWYRKQLEISCLGTDHRYSLEFDGVFRVAEIYVNGRRLFTHSSGYTGFSVDITSALTKGSNLLAVRVNNLWNARLNPRAGEHVFSGGIYRHVRLVETSSLHVAWYGTFVTTPRLNAAGGPVAVRTEVRNDAPSPTSYELRTLIYNSRGGLVQQISSRQMIAAGTTQSVDQTTPWVDHPELWSPAHPVLYTAQSEIYRDGRFVDSFSTQFGFRWVEWRADQGFFLNGTHLFFHGANVHQDHAGWGDAVSDDGVARDIHMIKEAGFDFIRGSHYPHSPVFADECDRQGVLFWSENSFWGIGGEHIEGLWTASAYPPNAADQAPFEQSVKTSLEEMIRIHRNHPSIIVWCMGNEVFFSDPELMPRVRAFLKELVALSHQLDPTRKVAIGGVQRGDIDHLSDIAGYNGDGARIYQNPGIASVVTEYGSTIADRPGNYEPGFGEVARQGEPPWRSGQAVWCGFDHGSIVPDLSRMGIVDYFRLPKRAWYWYRAAYTGVAAPPWPGPGVAATLRLTADSSTLHHADGRGSVQLTITVLDAAGREISNSPAVKLEILSGPGELPTGRSIEFAPDSDIAIRDGKAAIELRAYESGTIHLRASAKGLASDDLVLQSEGDVPFVDGQTPLVQNRPYVHRQVIRSTQHSARDLAIDHPTRADSELPGHEGRFANDGDLASYWQPRTTAGEESWWEVEFENRVRVDAVLVRFGSDADRSYVVEVPEKGGGWRPLGTRVVGAATPGLRLTALPAGERTATSMRIRFPSIQQGVIQVDEVRVVGTPIF